MARRRGKDYGEWTSDDLPVSPGLGHLDPYQDALLTQRDLARIRRELRARQARRIRPGFYEGLEFLEDEGG